MSEEKSLAQILYEAYCESTGWKSAVTGASLPEWVHCTPAVQAAWRATAVAAASHFKVLTQV